MFREIRIPLKLRSGYVFPPFWSSRTERPFRAWLLTLLLLWATPVTATKILLIGDSLSSGYGLEGPGWVELANRQLAERKIDMQIVNDSISGDTTAGGVARIMDGIDRVAPDWILIELGGNDGLRGLPLEIIKQNIRKMVDISRRHGVRPLLLGIRIPPNYGKAYTEQFAQIYVDVSRDTATPLLPFFIGNLALDPFYMQPDNIHPNDRAQPLIRDRVVPFLLSALEG